MGASIRDLCDIPGGVAWLRVTERRLPSICNELANMEVIMGDYPNNSQLEANYGMPALLKIKNKRTC